jgi:hypothetical protein
MVNGKVKPKIMNHNKIADKIVDIKLTYDSYLHEIWRIETYGRNCLPLGQDKLLDLKDFIKEPLDFKSFEEKDLDEMYEFFLNKKNELKKIRFY